MTQRISVLWLFDRIEGLNFPSVKKNGDLVWPIPTGVLSPVTDGRSDERMNGLSHVDLTDLCTIQ